MRINFPQNLDDLYKTLNTNQETIKHCIKYTEKYYTKGYETKSDGGIRKFDKPNKILKEIQRKIHDNFLKHYSLTPIYHGYIEKKSPITNAKIHINKESVLKTDIAIFFPSVTPVMVNEVFIKIGFPLQLANILTKLTTLDNYLPQGSPASPSLANIVLKPLVRKMEKWCRRRHLDISIFADDIAISGKNIREEHKTQIKNIITRSGFSTKETKTKIFHPSHERVKLTGIVINKRMGLPKNDVRKLRAIVHNCFIKGPSTQTTSDIIKFKAHLTGKIGLLKQVEFANPLSQRNRSVKKIIGEFNKIDWVK